MNLSGERRFTTNSYPESRVFLTRVPSPQQQKGTRSAIKPLLEIFRKQRERSKEACKKSVQGKVSQLPWNSPKSKERSAIDSKVLSVNDSPKSFSGLSHGQKKSALRRRQKREGNDPNILNTHKMAEIVVNYMHEKYPLRLFRNEGGLTPM